MDPFLNVHRYQKSRKLPPPPHDISRTTLKLHNKHIKSQLLLVILTVTVGLSLSYSTNLISLIVVSGLALLKSMTTLNIVEATISAGNLRLPVPMAGKAIEE